MTLVLVDPVTSVRNRRVDAFKQSRHHRRSWENVGIGERLGRKRQKRVRKAGQEATNMIDFMINGFFTDLSTTRRG